MSEWQPIDSAPKDETRVLLFNRDEADFTSRSRWDVRTGGFYEQLGGWIYDGENPSYSRAHAPTHWMPLPEALK